MEVHVEKDVQPIMEKGLRMVSSSTYRILISYSDSRDFFNIEDVVELGLEAVGPDVVAVH